MSVDIKFTEGKTKGELHQVLCVECHRLTEHRVTASFDKDGEESNRDEEWSVQWADHYQIVQCQGCKSVSFRHTDWFSENQDWDTGENVITERLYPKRDKNSLSVKDLPNVPTTLRRIYSEVIECFNNECLTLCAGGLRTAVEGICADNSVLDGPVQCEAKGGGKQFVRRSTLEGKISGLNEKGLIAAATVQTLHSLRFLGNEALHELSKPSINELRLAVEIVEHTLEGLYEVPEKSRELARKSSARRKPV